MNIFEQCLKCKWYKENTCWTNTCTKGHATACITCGIAKQLGKGSVLDEECPDFELQEKKMDEEKQDSTLVNMNGEPIEEDLEEILLPEESNVVDMHGNPVNLEEEQPDPFEKIKKEEAKAISKLQKILSKLIPSRGERKEALRALFTLSECSRVYFSELLQDFQSVIMQLEESKFRNYVLEQRTAIITNFLVDKGVITKEELETAWEEARRTFVNQMNELKKKGEADEES